MRRAFTCLAAAALLSGCGNDRTPPPDISVIGAPGDLGTVRFPQAGISLKAPSKWTQGPGEGRRLATFSSGEGQIAIWRYPRTEPLPETRAQLHATRRSLTAQVRARDPTFDLTSSRLILRPRRRAVELVGTGTTQGVKRSIRSLHSYGHRGEVVVDAFAPAKDFAGVDEQTFRPVLRSVRLRVARP